MPQKLGNLQGFCSTLIPYPLIPIFSGQPIPISRPPPINAGRKTFSAPAESALGFLHTEPNPRKGRVSHTIPKRGARLRRPRRAASERACSSVPRRGAPRGGTRARAAALRLFRPRHRMPSPRLHPLRARSPTCAASLSHTFSPTRAASPTHAPSPTQASSPSSAASTARKSAAHVFPHPSTSRRAAAR